MDGCLKSILDGAGLARRFEVVEGEAVGLAGGVRGGEDWRR